MPTFKKISGKWQECQALVKEGGMWMAIEAVTAKADGKWADIKPPEPPVDPRTWTNADFDRYLEGGDSILKIKSDIRQFFIVGDSFGIDLSGRFEMNWVSTPVPGLNVSNNYVGGVISGGVELSDVMTFSDDIMSTVRFQTSDSSNIPIKPAP